MDEVVLERLERPPIGEQRVEIVERKGLGHPDSICDAVMEEISKAINGEYHRRFGRILHNNIDKGLLVAGRVRRRFGGGRVLRPMELIVGDRASFRVGKIRIPIREIAAETAREWLRKHLRHMDAERTFVTGSSSRRDPRSSRPSSSGGLRSMRPMIRRRRSATPP